MAVGRGTAAAAPERPRAPRTVRSRSALVLVTGATAVAAIASLVFLERESIWLDEAYSVFLARLPAGEFWDVLVSAEANASLYYVLLRGWIGLGENEAMVRLLSVLFGVAAIPLTYLVGVRLLGRRVATTGAAFLAVSAFAIQYAQEARSYSLVLLLVIMSSYVFVRAVQVGGPGNWAAYIIVTALSGYAHFFAWFVALAQLASVPFLDRRPSVRTLAAVYTGVGVLSTPLLAFLVGTTGNQIGWIPPLSLERVASAIGQFAGGRTSIGAGGLVVILSVCIVLALRSLLLLWQRRGRSPELWSLALVVAWLTVPIAGALAISLFKPIWLDKYLIVALPGLVLTAAAGLWTWRPALAWVALVVVAVVSLSQVLVLHSRLDKDDWRSGTRFVLARSEPSDGIAFYRPNGRFPFGYYADRLEVTNDRAPTPVARMFDRSRGPTTPGPRNVPLSRITDASGSFGRVWIILNPTLPEARATLQMLLKPLFIRAGTVTFRDVVVDLYVHRGRRPQD